MSAPNHVGESIAVQQDERSLFSQATQLCRKLLPDWINLAEADVKVSKVSGGITNVLLKVSPTRQHDPVLVRVFGDHTDEVINRGQEEKITLQLFQAGFGAEVLGTFDNGRVETWLHMRPLTPEQMCEPGMAACIAKRLADFHAADIQGVPKEPQIFQFMLKWLDQAAGMTYPDAGKQKAKEAKDFKAMQSEIMAMQQTCEQLDSPVVFSHNDLLSGNIMVPLEGTPELTALQEGQVDASTMQFIDFEYGSYNYRGFDFANHWCEYAGFEGDYIRYPDRKQQTKFVTGYLQQTGTATPAADQVEQLIVEGNVLALVSHQFWGTWALIQARYSAIDFDYMEYSSMRWDEYQRRKAEFLAPVQ